MQMVWSTTARTSLMSASADAGMQPAKYQNTDSHLAPSILQLETSFFHPHGPRNAADLMIDER